MNCTRSPSEKLRSVPRYSVTPCKRRGSYDEIVRQKDPALKEAVEQLARGDVREAIENLDGQGRVHQIEDRDARLTAIAEQ